MKKICMVCQSEFSQIKEGVFCNSCISSSGDLEQKLMGKFGEKKGQMLLMGGYPETLLELNDETIDILYETMMYNIKMGII